MTISRNITINGAAGYAASVSSGGSGSGDPNWGSVSLLVNGDNTSTSTVVADANTKLLLNFDEASGSFIDTSGNNHTVTTYGTFVRSTQTKKFGNSSGSKASGVSHYLSVPGSIVNFGTGDFTIEFWGYSTTNTACLGVGSPDGTSTMFTVGELGTGTLGFGVRSTSWDLVSGNVFTVNTWHHIAIVRSSGTCKIYLNGVSVASNTLSTNFTGATSFEIGRRQAGYSTDACYFDDLRISNIARYTSNFTAPTTSFSGSGTSILDSSAVPRVITTTGTVSTTTSVAKYGKSMYFDGGINSLSFPKISLSGDFTIEFWIYRLAEAHQIVVSANTSDTQMGVGNQSAGAYMAKYGTGTQATLNGTTNKVPLNTWKHVAFVRSGSTGYIFIDGTLDVSGAFSSAAAVEIEYISRHGPSTGYNINGYLDDLRITNGIARYTSNFAVPTSATSAASDQYAANVSLLLTGDGTNGSNTFTDSSITPKTVTSYGNARIDTTTKKYGTGSMYFDGNGDYSSLPTGVGYFTGDFTVECWVNPSVIGSLSGIFTLNVANAWNFDNSTTSMNGLSICADSIVYGASVIDPYTLSTNTWQHLAVSRQGTSLRVFINGVLTKNITYSGTLGTANNNTAGLGVFDKASGSLRNFFTGYIDDFRITNGIARYTTNFTPPTAALPTSAATGGVVPDQYSANVSLLLNGDGTNGSTTFTDSSSSPKSFTTYGNARIDTTTKKYGTGSMYFDGTGDYIQTTSNSVLNFGTADFTVEMWVYLLGTGDYTIITSTGQSTTNTNIRLVNDTLRIGSLGYTWENTSPALSLSTSTWYHLAISRQGTTLKMFKNGTQVLSGTNSQNYTSTSGTDIASNAVGAGYFYGYLDDIRVTKGIARYTANFTPPTAPLTL